MAIRPLNPGQKTLGCRCMGVLALVGTRKGLFLLRADAERKSWRAEGPLLDGWGVYHAILDERDGTIYAAANHLVYGPTVQRSRDGGKTWRRSRQIALPEESGLTVNATWHVEPGRPEEPGTLYLGGARPSFRAPKTAVRRWEAYPGDSRAPDAGPLASVPRWSRSALCPARPQRRPADVCRDIGRGHIPHR